MKYSILCVDDEVDNVEALERLFRRKYTVFKATSGAEALKILAEKPMTVIISDQRMPQMTGVELLAASIQSHPSAIRILLTGYTDISSVIEAINSGHIYRYVTKPWDPVDLANAVDKAVERFELGAELFEKNQALTLALEELQSLDQAKTQFMLLVNHELRTPLTSMLSFADLLAETRLDADQKLYLSRVRSAAQRLQEMINDVLEFVTAETAQMRVDKKIMKAKDLFVPVPEWLQNSFAHRQVNLLYEIDNQTVLADEKIIRNVYRRLLHNAAKFADAGSEVVITGHSEAKYYDVSIMNIGKPLDEARIRQILKPFTLNENAMNHSTGTGLGLPIAQALLKLHKSTLDITCRDNQIKVSFLLEQK